MTYTARTPDCPPWCVRHSIDDGLHFHEGQPHRFPDALEVTLNGGPADDGSPLPPVVTVIGEGQLDPDQAVHLAATLQQLAGQVTGDR